MAIDRSKFQEPGGFRWAILLSWLENSHEVALMKYEGIAANGKDVSVQSLKCECDFNGGENKDSCKNKEKVRIQFRKEVIERNQERWQGLGVKEAILDIAERVDGGEYLGQWIHQLIYMQEVAELLNVSLEKIEKYCKELRSEKKLGFNGRMLRAYCEDDILGIPDSFV